jgi:hypothetical protein
MFLSEMPAEKLNGWSKKEKDQFWEFKQMDEKILRYLRLKACF